MKRRTESARVVGESLISVGWILFFAALITGCLAAWELVEAPGFKGWAYLTASVVGFLAWLLFLGLGNGLNVGCDLADNSRR
jgi:uncharacterized membrane protein